MKADNKTKTLQTDSNADLIFKKGDYIHTYVVIETSGLPDGATLHLLDENLNQLYSPYDINANQVKTPCTIIVGETDALQLPANYIDNEYTDFDVGTYNWKLKYHDIMGKTFEDKIIPITIKIQDFDLETNLTPEIYPGENIQIQLKTWLNTNPSVNDFDNDRLTTNANYNDSTGIITYPNSDIINVSVGEHTQIINQSKNYYINYKVLNPIKAFVGDYNGSNNRTSFTYLEDKWFSIYTESDKTGGICNNASYGCSDCLESTWRMGYVNGLNTHIDVGYYKYSPNSKHFLSSATIDPNHTVKVIIPPGTYTWDISAKTINYNTEFYQDSKTFEISTENCTLTLSRDENNIIATYMYNNETPIPNASIQMIEDGTVVNTLITDSNGQCSVTGQYNSTYKAQAIDYDNSILLESSTLTMELEFITINITNVPSEYEWFVIFFNGAPEDMMIINFSQSYMGSVVRPTNIDRLTLENNILSINIDKYLLKKYVINYNTRNSSISMTWPTKYLYNLEDNDNDDIITVAFEDLPNQQNEG